MLEIGRIVITLIFPSFKVLVIRGVENSLMEAGKLEGPGGVRFVFLNSFGFSSFREIRSYHLQKSLHFVSVSSANNFKVVWV